jgi:YD repeat-containing protein
LKGATYDVTDIRDSGGYLLYKTYSDGDSVGSPTNPWLYDDVGRQKSIPGHVTNFTYNARGQVTSATYANGVTTTNTYNDARGWLNRVVTPKGATALQDLTYTRAL